MERSSDRLALLVALVAPALLLISVSALSRTGCTYYSSPTVWGFIDHHGSIVIAPRFDQVGSFSGGLAAASIRNADGMKCGYINKKGRTAIPFRYDSAGPFADGLAAVDAAGQRGFIDHNGQMTIPARFDARPVRQRRSLLDWLTGRPPTSTPVESRFSEGLAPVRMTDSGLCGYIDSTGAVRIPARFTVACPFAEGLAPVLMSDQWGFIDHSGQLVLPPRFANVRGFTEGLAAVSIPGEFESTDHKFRLVEHWGYIDHSGRFAIRPQYAFARSFDRGQASVILPVLEDAHVDIDRAGHQLPRPPRSAKDPAGMALSAKALHVEPFSEGLAAFDVPKTTAPPD
jgi:hypothetical protein